MARVAKEIKVLIGLEIHVQLATASKMFTGVANGFGGEPNTQVDPVVLGLPGVLPVMNKRAVEHSIKAGLALGCRIAHFTKWDRKSYYYPDLPKNYQISQYDLPLCGEGVFEIIDEAGRPMPIRIRRAHLEEDAGKLMHDAPGGYPIDHSIVDLNRAGTPLLEIVTEPDFTTAKQVATFGQELQKLVQYLGISEAQMQMGHMRFEPNINVHITDQDGKVHKTAITEIKNLNSFSVLERATDYEIRRQIRHWEETGELGRKCTRGWDESTGTTFLQREKEDAHDYRYFPDPDLVPVVVDEAWLEQLRSEIGELPVARRKRYIEALGLAGSDVDVLAGDRAVGDLYEAIMAAGADGRRAANLVVNVLGQLAKREGRNIAALGIAPQRIAEVAKLIDSSKLAAANALPVFEKLLAQDAPAEQVATQLGLIQSSDTSAIDAAIDALLAQPPKAVEDFKAGKQAALGSLVGLIMKGTKGLNPRLVQERLKQRLGA